MESSEGSDRPHLLIGRDARALAQNATDHGRPVVVVDDAGSLDTSSLCPSRSIRRDSAGPFSLRTLVELARGTDYAGVVPMAGFENDILTLAKTGDLGRLVGCSLETIRKTRNPESLIRTAQAWNFNYPHVVYNRHEIHDPENWLQKPFSSYGGHNIHRLSDAPAEASEGLFYQNFVPGIASAAAIVSDGQEAFVLGVSTQIIGDNAFGASDFITVGGIHPHPFAVEITKQVAEVADALTLEYDLKGLWGFDFIYDGAVNLVEVNPRPTTGHALVAMASWNDLLGLHIDSVTRKYSNLIVDPGDTSAYVARARVFAREETIFTGAANWLEQGACDIPFDGDLIRAGEPILTLTARSESYNGALGHLHEKASSLYASLRQATTSSL